MKSAVPVLLALAVAAACLAAIPSFAATGDWATGQKAQVRLLAAGIGKDGKLAAGIEIALPEDWHTYWRSPGDAGIAPIIDFSASKNVASATVSYPTPSRLDDGDSVTNIYEHDVVLPVSVVPANPARPVELAAHLQIGVCGTVCVPDDIRATLTVKPGAGDPDVDATLADARNAVPGPPQPGVFAFTAVTRDGGTDSHPVFRFTGTVPDARDASLFVEGPDGWSPYTPDFAGDDGGKAVWSVKFSRLGAETPIAGAKFRLTAVSGGRAIDQTIGVE